MTKYFTDSPYEKEMMEIPYVPMEKSKKEEFRKSLSYHNSCKFCMYYSQGKNSTLEFNKAKDVTPLIINLPIYFYV